MSLAIASGAASSRAAVGAQVLHVDGTAMSPGDGSAEHPFWSITLAIMRARQLRELSDQPIIVDVAPLPPVPSRFMPTPAPPTVAPAAGSLSAGTYSYRLSAYNDHGITAASAAASIRLTAAGGVQLTWAPVAGAVGYLISGNTPGSEVVMAALDGTVPGFVDDGSYYLSFFPPPTQNTTGDGVYEGTYEGHGDLAVDRREVLPILLNVKNLTLHGASVLVHGAGGFTTGEVVEGTQTKLMAIGPRVQQTATGIPPAFPLLLVTRTADQRSGDGTTVEGMVLDGAGFGGMAASSWTATYPLAVFLAQGVQIRNNLVQNGDVNILTGFASATIEGNHSAWANDPAMYSIAGSPNDPAVVDYRNNRATSSRQGIILVGTAGGFSGAAANPWPAGGNVSPAIPQILPAVPASAGDVPNGLVASVTGNDLSANVMALRFNLFGPSENYPGLRTALVNAQVLGNRMDDNIIYALVADAGSVPRNAPLDSAQLHATFGGNSLLSNNSFFDGKGAFFTFTFLWDPIFGTLADYSYLDNSLYQITDLDGELSRAGFDIDNPASDPIGNAPLHNQINFAPPPP